MCAIDLSLVEGDLVARFEQLVTNRTSETVQVVGVRLRPQNHLFRVDDAIAAAAFVA